MPIGVIKLKWSLDTVLTGDVTLKFKSPETKSEEVTE